MRIMAVISIVDLKELAGVFGAMADAIAKFGDSIAHLVQLGASGWDALSARMRSRQILDMYQRLVLYRGDQAMAAYQLGRYITEWKATRSKGSSSAEWSLFTSRIAQLVREVANLLEGVRSEKSDFVLEDAYQTLISTLNFRMVLFERLEKSKPPTTSQEIEAYEQMAAEWERLRAELLSAINALSAYIEAAEQGDHEVGDSAPTPSRTARARLRHRRR
jgi:hypothetical protein